MQREIEAEIEKNKQKENKKRPLPEEPNENNPDSALIALRCPHDGSLLKRRFLKTEKIQVLISKI